uniref:Mini-chromosome maintenance complex-binding protein n=1 Tax=Trichuris muris TaxID=70415 RepID=A0A5S6R4S9_TRIMR
MAESFPWNAFLSDPLKFLDEFLTEICVKQLNSHERFVSELRSRVLNERHRWNEIELYDPYTEREISSKSLVRFRGMVQDMLEDEYFVARSEHPSLVHANFFREHNYDANNDSTDPFVMLPQCLESRHLYRAVSIPGETEWVKEISFVA